METPSDHGSEDLAHLLRGVPGAVLATHAECGDATAIVPAGRLVEVLRFLRDDPSAAFDMLMDLSGVDYVGYPGRSGPRFEVVRERRARVEQAAGIRRHAQFLGPTSGWRRSFG